ncbi:MAG: Type 4 fimbrial assembly protein pilC [Candidatus Daviesbacteria bacterium GW2011_GWA1_38_7]|nr:MAG: Type 4 fimbrial assembly protein pilC [Candidatus Daviesbacteria bacterium GW2011_GWA1_38_7]
MIQSGLVLSEAIDILRDQQTNKYYKAVLDDISRDVKGGLDLASSLKKHPDVFPDLYSNLVKAGESSGKLDTVLLQMASNLEKTREFRGKVKGALIYPIIILVTMFVVMLVMMFFVIPRMTSLYAQSNIELPLPTLILIATSSFLINFWYLILGVGIFGGFIFKRWISTEIGRYSFDSFLLKFPVIKKIVEGITLAEFTRTFGLLITAGIPMLDSINIVSGVINNAVYRKALKDTFRGIERGLTLSNELEAVGVFPKIIPAMIRVGEETGQVDQVAFKLAEYFESESDQIVKNLTVIIEPVILVVLGVGVAFLVLSIILPIYKLTTSFS